MGKDTQKRIIRKLDLELFLSNINSHPSPNLFLEQYTTPVNLVATILHVAAYTYDDIIGKNLLDLGCGTGRIALGASYLGAKSIVGIDLDKLSIQLAYTASLQLNMKNSVNFVVGDVDLITGRFDTVIQNPPFGVQNHAADRKFLKKALEVGKKVYSLHNHPYSPKSSLKPKQKFEPNNYNSYIHKIVKTSGGDIQCVYTFPLIIDRMFTFHKKIRHTVLVDLYIIKTNN